jgi:molybdopterin-guanine dinucleotide biosynthesis protein A
MTTENRVTGAILAGGRARRMGGQDKGLLTLAGEPMISHVIRMLQPQVDALIISANRNVETYAQFGYPIVSDSLDGFPGPLAGMLAAMDHARSDFIITVPCDSPLLFVHYCDRMMQAMRQTHCDLVVAADGSRIQPVFTLLRTSLREDLSQYIQQGGRKIDLWFARHHKTIADFSDHLEMFRNINTPDELAALEKELQRSV